MPKLPTATHLYIATVVVAGAVLALMRLPAIAIGDSTLFVILLGLSALTSTLKVNLPLAKSQSTMTVSYAVNFTALLLLGADQAMLIAAASAWSQCTFRVRTRNPVHRTLFSVATLILTVQAAGLVFRGLGGTAGLLDVQALVVPAAGAAMTYFVVNTLTVAVAVALSNGQVAHQVWRENFLWSAPGYFVGAAAGCAAASITQQSGYWIVPLTLLPIYLIYRSYRIYLGRIDDEQRHVREVSDLHLAAIEALALAIDAKEQLPQSHGRRMQTYAAELARALGMSDSEVQGVKTAALLHDVGKLAVPAHILSKAGPLTEQEFEKVRAHSRVGAQIVERVPFPYPVAPLILGHHERWDGTGYPDGLCREQIPLGARILSVVDLYDAVTSERSYHAAADHEAALAVLRQEAGRALDPRVVETFIELLPSFRSDAETCEPSTGGLVSEGTTSPNLVRPQPDANIGGVFLDIARAHREIYALYEIAQALGTSLGVSDTMTLVSSKLRSLVPFSCCALFLYDDRSDTLHCQFATGVDASIIEQVVVERGRGATGRVAATKEPVLNGSPRVDLDAAGVVGRDTTLRAALICPLILGDRLIGTLAVYHEAENFYSEDHRRLLERVSEQAAAVVSNSLLFEQTQEDSLTDPLTGLPNTRFLLMHLTRELARARRYRTPVTLLVMDLDNFKQINDTHGHHAGDRALLEVAQVLRAAIRPYDICVRYAGDEFIVVLAGCDAEEAEQKRLELQSAIAAVTFEGKPGRELPLSVSIGSAVFPQDGAVYESLLATADSRMYQDKARRKASANRPLPDPTRHLARDSSRATTSPADSLP